MLPRVYTQQNTIPRQKWVLLADISLFAGNRERLLARLGDLASGGKRAAGDSLGGTVTISHFRSALDMLTGDVADM